jgi:hypothetical protein
LGYLRRGWHMYFSFRNITKIEAFPKIEYSSIRMLYLCSVSVFQFSEVF